MGRAARLLPLALAVGLAACGGADRGVSDAAPCPRIAILAEGADLTRFRAGAERDLTAMVVDARIAGFDARCDWASRDRRALDVRVTPRFQAERGPGFDGRAVDLPWFVALTDASDSTLLERMAATTRVSFPANVPTAGATGQALRLTVPVGGEVRARDYNLRLSFQLTPEELALNRSRGPR
jgi:hypothetical protein